jgi:hypothetical protein
MGNPKFYGPGEGGLLPRRQTHAGLPLQERVLKFIVDHPLQLVLGSVLPIVGSTYYVQSLDPLLSLSQRMMHTRVISQFSIISVLVGTMVAHDYLTNHGVFDNGERRDVHD